MTHLGEGWPGNCRLRLRSAPNRTLPGSKKPRDVTTGLLVACPAATLAAAGQDGELSPAARQAASG